MDTQYLGAIGASPEVLTCANFVRKVVRPMPYAQAVIDAITYGNAGFYFLTDIGPNGSLWYSNGASLNPVGAEFVFAKGAGLSLSNPGDTAEHVLATITIPGGLLGPNAVVEVYTVWELTNSANAKNPRVRFGAAGAGTSANQLTTTSGTNAATLQCLTRIHGNSDIAHQFSYSSMGSPFGQTATAFNTAAINTAANTDIVISAQLATATETATLQSYLVRIAP